jgi:hypothetical protein
MILEINLYKKSNGSEVIRGDMTLVHDGTNLSLLRPCIGPNSKSMLKLSKRAVSIILPPHRKFVTS